MAFLEDYLSKRNLPFTQGPEGLLYHIERQGEGNLPQSGEYAKVHYTGKFLDGRAFDSSVERNEPFVVPVGQQKVIRGWDIGLGLFPVGSKGVLYVPPELGYGMRGAGNVIPPNASLIFEIEMLEVMDEEAFKKHEAEENAKQEKALREYLERQMAEDFQKIKAYMEQSGKRFEMTSNGLFYRIDQEGEGPKPENGQNVSVHYTGRLLTGQVFDSSIQRGQPISFPIGTGQVIQGWDLGIPLFSEGGKGTLLIPSPMAYGPRDMGSIPANAILEFDIELVKVG
ncbi:MAG: FKBP-type peptidyl-prolyl cis-trans isomerase [Bacteroidota bacterium]